MVPVYAIMLKYLSQLIVAMIMKDPIIQTWFAPKYAFPDFKTIWFKMRFSALVNVW